jgi:molybdate transport system substrate-binding protein
MENGIAMRGLLLTVALVTGLTLAAVSIVPAHGADLTVFAAASLKEALDEQVTRFQADAGSKVVVSYGASNALAKQIEAGAPADVILSADIDWIDYLDQRKLLRPGTRINLLGNRLVLIAPADSRSSLRIARGFGLAAALDGGRLAMGNPDSVPAGKYGRDALRSLGVWADIEPHIARAENVRTALLLVARGEAPFGIVYATDALAEPKVRIVDTFPENTHAAIVYPVAVVATSRSPYAQRLIDSLASPGARAIWARHGFTTAN